MDLNDVRILWTVLSFAAFLGIVAWAYSGKRKSHFDEAARLVLDDDASDPAARPDRLGSNKNHGSSQSHGQGRAT